MPLSRDDFARWRDDPVTRAVVEAFRNVAADNKALWLSHSWNEGQANPLLLKELRTRADAYLAIAELTYEALCETNGEEPSDES